MSSPMVEEFCESPAQTRFSTYVEEPTPSQESVAPREE
jgi:hypothetical protein